MVPPSVNTSEAVFTARDGKIFYAIGAIKGVGQAVAEHIVAARGDTPFADLADFATRVDPRIINKRTLETLVNAGAFDCLVPKREQAFAAIDMMIATAQRTNANATDGIIDMFASDTPEPIRLTANVAGLGPGRAAGARARGHRLSHLGASARRLCRAVRDAEGHALCALRDGGEGERPVGRTTGRHDRDARRTGGPRRARRCCP